MTETQLAYNILILVIYIILYKFSPASQSMDCYHYQQLEEGQSHTYAGLVFDDNGSGRLCSAVTLTMLTMYCLSKGRLEKHVCLLSLYAESRNGMSASHVV